MQVNINKVVIKILQTMLGGLTIYPPVEQISYGMCQHIMRVGW